MAMRSALARHARRRARRPPARSASGRAARGGLPRDARGADPVAALACGSSASPRGRAHRGPRAAIARPGPRRSPRRALDLAARAPRPQRRRPSTGCARPSCSSTAAGLARLLVAPARRLRPAATPPRARPMARELDHVQRPCTLINGRAADYKVFLGHGRRRRQDLPDAQEGHAELEDGRDVVIGLLETHGRAETAALAEGLRCVPRRRVDYRDTELEEMDLPAILRRAPGAVPDRRARAHQRARASSTPSATRTSRTCSTPASTCSRRVNVQHLESLNDQRRRAQRRARARDDPRRGARPRRRGRAHRSHARGAARAAARRQGLPARAHRRRAQQLLPDREPRRAARGRAAPGRRGGRGQAPGHRASSARARTRSPPTRAAGGRRAAARARRALPGRAAARAPRVALGPAPRRRARPAVGRAAGPRARRGRASARWQALRQLASVLGAHLLVEEADDVAETVARGRRASAARPTS